MDIIKKIIPIQKREVPKFLCVMMLMFLISYVHRILHISKEVLIISHLGAESISAIKMWAILPTSLIFMFLYIKLADKLTRAQLFHAATWGFISYFILFAAVLYPHREVLTIEFNEAFISKLTSLRYLFEIIKYWHYSLFYVFAEGWVVIMLAISFWQTANHITTVESSKRIYPLIGAAAGFGSLTAGILAASCVTDCTTWQPTLNNITVSIVVAGVCISLCIGILEGVVGKENFNHKTSHFHFRSKISLKDSLKYISTSKIILLITMLLFGFNVSLNLVDGVWKKTIEIFFNSDANQIHYFISKVDIVISILSTIGAFVGVYILRNFEWKTSALITPIIALVAGSIFFLFMFLQEINGWFAIKTCVMAIAMYLGATYDVFVRALKNSLFDPTKERVYIPLDDDLQTKGKAAAEIIGMRFGRGSGSFVQQILLGLFPALTLLDLSPIIFVIFLLVIAGWFYSAVVLSKLVQSGQQLSLNLHK